MILFSLLAVWIILIQLCICLLYTSINLDTLEETIQSELLKSEYRECEGELYDGYPAAKFCYLLNKLYPLPENAF